MSFRLLIIEDDYALAQMLAMHFEDEGYEVGTAQTCAEAVESLNSEACDLVLLDQQLPDGEGIDLLAAIVEQDADLPIVMMTGAHDLDLAIRAIKCGAFDFVHKPVAIEPLRTRSRRRCSIGASPARFRHCSRKPVIRCRLRSWSVAAMRC